jgi:hypothetical protein
VVANSAVTEGISFTYQPYSHSLLAAVVWSLLAWALSRVLHVDRKGAALIGLVVLSHWFLDLIAHRPDLPLWPGGPKVGFGLWDKVGLELGLELLLFLAGGTLVLTLFRREGKRIWPLGAFLALGVLFMVGTSSIEPPATIDPVAIGGMSLAVYIVFIVLAWLIDRGSLWTKDGRVRN